MQSKATKMPKVFILVLNYNGRQTVLNCLKSIYAQDYPNFEVVLIDNNSTDESFELAKQNFSNAHFIKNNFNLGFAAGNNVGIRFALEKFADYVFLLNNDAYLEKNTLSLLIQKAAKNPTALVSPLIEKNDGATWFAEGKINWLTMKTMHIRKNTKNKCHSSEYLTGCALLVGKKVFQKIGLMDENFFLYYEDADFSLRAKKAGFSLLVYPEAKIIHDEQSNENNPEKIYWLVVSGLRFFQKHTPFYLQPWLWLYLNLRKTKNLCALLFQKNPRVLQVRKAYQDFKQYSA